MAADIVLQRAQVYKFLRKLADEKGRAVGSLGENFELYEIFCSVRGLQAVDIETFTEFIRGFGGVVKGDTFEIEFTSNVKKTKRVKCYLAGRPKKEKKLLEPESCLSECAER
ncbi:hypothetical protein [Methanosarcina siciliae]|nr:hypothetical protein [Methanosarcina siciliae]